MTPSSTTRYQLLEENSDAAAKIESDLQKFRLPREVRKRLGRRHLNIFRDVNDLTGNRLTPAPLLIAK
jgi:hypothetical protein